MNERHSGVVMAGLAALLTLTVVMVFLAVRHGETTVTNSTAPPTLTPQPSSSSSSTTTAPAGLAIVGGGMNYANSTSADKFGTRSWLAYFTVANVEKAVFVSDGLTTTEATKLVTGGPFAELIISTADDDAAVGKSADQSVTDMAALVTKTKTANDSVMVIPLSPATTFTGAKIRAFNEQLQTAAKARGWAYCDAWAPVRGADGQWADAADSALGGRGVSSTGAKKVATAVENCVTSG